jgi:O-antigen ligase
MANAKDRLTYFVLGGILVSLVYSPFALTLGMILLALVTFLDWQGGLRFDPAAWERLARALRQPDLLAWTFPFLLVLLAVWGLEDPAYWIERLRVKLAFLALPLTFIGMRRLRAREIDGLLYFFVLLLFFSCLAVVANYSLNFATINAALERGQPMPTPRNHIRFSVLAATAVVAGIHLIVTGYYWRYRWEKKLLLLLTALLFLSIHVLSVRTGLVVLYGALFALANLYLLRARAYRTWLATLLGLLLLPLAAYFLVPSLQTRIDYMRYDLFMHRRGEGENYADSGRIASLRVGYEIWRAAPLLGTGAGGLRPEVHRRFAAQYPGYPNPLMPHNQWLYIAASTGLLGLAGFVLAFAFPLFYRQNWRYPPLLGVYTIVFLLFAIEHTIENSMGAGYVAFFLPLLLNRERYAAHAEREAP